MPFSNKDAFFSMPKSWCFDQFSELVECIPSNFPCLVSSPLTETYFRNHFFTLSTTAPIRLLIPEARLEEIGDGILLPILRNPFQDLSGTLSFLVCVWGRSSSMLYVRGSDSTSPLARVTGDGILLPILRNPFQDLSGTLSFLVGL